MKNLQPTHDFLHNHGLTELSGQKQIEIRAGVHPGWIVAAAVGGGIVGIAVGLGVAYLVYKYL